MCIVQDIAETIDKSGMTIREVARRGYIDDRTIYKIKAQEQKPKPHHIFAISQATNEPTLIRSMCFEECPIGQRFGFRPLNNVNKTLLAVLNKSHEEAIEFIDTLQQMIQVILNKDYKKADEKPFFKGLQELLDFLHCGQEIVDASIREWGFDVVAREFEKHHDKCIKEGYIKEKAPEMSA
ncbi:MAG: hypothetical protein PWQ82_1159 [Thermosediminibacterales bacterium]|nr:hypothetical protein [Thermosediminibacterales bacterium]